ncbi:glycosyltransferase family 2 protein [uncultured Roseobacter sp.]|uniref:glycosyltransferase family 2 protein n=1 Tax=uncultured Roseobacter sp. TaxID=114847 RepID=UPI002608E5F5|nr:glycosyltransferase family 2 protein [uncultured Roseobacter sp.]
MPCKLAISIINYRTRDLTLGCVASVLDDIGTLDARIVVVDNASGDGSAEAIADWIAAQPAETPVELVRSPVNTGFSGGHNQGIAAVEAEHYLLLNSDAVLRRGFLRAILAAAEAQPQAGLIAPRIETDAGEVQVSQFRFHNPWSELDRAAGAGPVSRLLRRRVVALSPPADPAEVEWASFACILLRGEMVRALGPMDEGYFLYYEDAEYCLRARRAGWSIALAPEAVAVHFRGGSGPVKKNAKARKRLPAYYYSSRTRFLYQAHGRAGLTCANLAWHVGRVLARTRTLLGGRPHLAVQQEARDIWTNFRTPLGPRHAPGE